MITYKASMGSACFGLCFLALAVIGGTEVLVVMGGGWALLVQIIPLTLAAAARSTLRDAYWHAFIAALAGPCLTISAMFLVFARFAARY